MISSAMQTTTKLHAFLMPTAAAANTTPARIRSVHNSGFSSPSSTGCEAVSQQSCTLRLPYRFSSKNDAMTIVRFK